MVNARAGPIVQERTKPPRDRSGIETSAPPGLQGPRILDAMDGFWLAVVWTLLPTVVVSALFFWILRSVLHADRNERRAYARIEAKERAKRGLPAVPATSGPDDAPPAALAGR